MTKYVTKPEISMTKGIAAMIRNILKGTIEDGLNVQAALKRSMAKLLGERMMCKQEKSHLILSLPMVSCSHQFCKVYLDDDLNLIDLEEKNMIEKKNNNQEDDENNITIKSIVSIYGNRMNKNNWRNEKVYKKTLS